MAKLMYGGGLRLMECLRLRVMDLDFAKAQVYVRGKGGKDRMTTLPPSICEDLEAHLSRVKKLHDADLAAGHGDVYLPEALARKFGEGYPSREESPGNPVDLPYQSTNIFVNNWIFDISLPLLPLKNFIAYTITGTLISLAIFDLLEIQ